MLQNIEASKSFFYTTGRSQHAFVYINFSNYVQYVSMSVTSAFCEHVIVLYYTCKLFIVGNLVSFSLLYNQGEEEKTPLDF
jgi:hypothetical protein